jgi:hypothetical protein
MGPWCAPSEDNCVWSSLSVAFRSLRDRVVLLETFKNTYITKEIKITVPKGGN